MSVIKFTDGVVVNTDGKPRAVTIKGDVYVVGDGCMLPCYGPDDVRETLDTALKYWERKQGKPSEK